jgi:hypothetical protein
MLHPRKFPEAHVIGNDISPIQPNWVCPNLEFVVEDYEAEWLYIAESFDLIHARLLAGTPTTPPPPPPSRSINKIHTNSPTSCIAD